MAARAAIESELLLRLMNATPEQYAAVERILGCAGDWSWELGDRESKPGARFVLRREFRNWPLVYEGATGVLRDCRAVRLLDDLLKHPPDEPLHATEWELRVDGRPLVEGAGAMGRAEDDGRPGDDASGLGGLMQEGTGRDFAGRISLPALKAKLMELRAAKEDPTLPGEERAAAATEYRTLLRAHARGGKLNGEAERAVDRVRKQIKTLIRELQAAEVTRGKANAVLRAFGRHLEECLWLPSVGGRKRVGAAGKPGCFTYEPPAGVNWID